MATKKKAGAVPAKGRATKKAAPPKTPAKARPKAKRTAPKAVAARKKAQERAAVLAARMPLVHYPASDRFEDWADGPRRWPGLQSKAARGAPYPSTDFGRLRGEHVFCYAGPSCYFKADSAGNALLYFEPDAHVGKGGAASPFDSGSLEDPTPKLRPWAQQALDERWRFFQRHAVAIADWRARFERWLAASYDEPDRYLEAIPDRYAAGQPDRLDPPEILQHNGTRGLALYKGDCADRRAWTWEVRIERELSWAAVRAVHVPFSLIRLAAAWAHEVEAVYGNRPDVRTLPPGEPADFNGLYAASGATLTEMVDA